VKECGIRHNKGFFDRAVYNVNSTTYNRYVNFKLGLFLLAQKVTGFPSNITEKVEAAAWNYQNDLAVLPLSVSWMGLSMEQPMLKLQQLSYCI